MNAHVVKVLYMFCKLVDAVRNCARESDFSKNIALYLRVVAVIDQQQFY